MFEASFLEDRMKDGMRDLIKPSEARPDRIQSDTKYRSMRTTDLSYGALVTDTNYSSGNQACSR